MGSAVSIVWYPTQNCSYYIPLCLKRQKENVDVNLIKIITETTYDQKQCYLHRTKHRGTFFIFVLNLVCVQDFPKHVFHPCDSTNKKPKSCAKSEVGNAT